MERVGDLKLGFPAGVFSQANPFTARKLYEQGLRDGGPDRERKRARSLLRRRSDFALSCAGAARQVWAVDDSELVDCHGEAERAPQRSRQLPFCRRRCRRDDHAAYAELCPRIDLIVLNPPRKGVQSAAMDAVLAAGAPRIIYVSCEPGSLARDLDRLVGASYRVSQVQPFDMFPQTEEVETVALLNKA